MKRVTLLLLLLFAGFALYETATVKPGNSRKNSVAITVIEPGHKKESGVELKDAKNSDWGKTIYVENDVPKNKRSFIENFATFSEYATAISTVKGIKTNYPDPVVFKKLPTTSFLLPDSLVQMKNNSKGGIQPGQKHFVIAWTYTPFLSYEWAQYRIDSDLPAVNSIKQGNEHEPSFSTGILLTGQFTEKWMLQSGIVYSNTTIDIAPQKIYAVQSPDGDYAYKYITSAGYGYIRPGFAAPPSLGDSLLTAEAEHTLRHITIPLEIKYRIGRGRLSFIPGAGIAANFLTGTKVETEIKNSTNKEIVTITKLTGTKNLNWSLTADAEMQYQLNNKMSVNLRPAFRYAISSITRNDDFQTFPYAFGIGLGMTFKF